MKEKMTIIFFSGTMDKAIAMLTLATTAAAMDMDVTVFFTFWGLSFLKKGKKYSKKGLFQKMLEFMIPKRMDALPLSSLNMLGMGPWMMEKLMKKTKSPGIEELFEMAKELKVKFLACSTSCSVMGVDRENMIDEVQDIVGAASYIKEAREGKINLCI
ncbi:MAG: DsrE/DsrF/DrsH-like family protein [Elusimicrobiota bacterium]